MTLFGFISCLYEMLANTNSKLSSNSNCTQ